MAAEDEGDWIEVRRASSSVEADMVRDFLHDHGVASAVNGDSGGTRLPWQHAMMEIRIVVAPADLAEARQVLAAMSSSPGEHPFRGAAPPPRDEDEGPYVARRSAMAAALLALLVPIGAGHFYARHGAAGSVLCAGIAGALLGLVLGHRELTLAWALLVLFDGVGATLAVRRFNAQSVPTDAAQRRFATVALVVAFGAAWLVGRS